MLRGIHYCTASPPGVRIYEAVGPESQIFNFLVSGRLGICIYSFRSLLHANTKTGLDGFGSKSITRSMVYISQRQNPNAWWIPS